MSLRRNDIIEPELSHEIIGAFYRVFNTLGFGFLEYIYVRALEQELRGAGIKVAREVLVPVHYKGTVLGYQRLDMLIAGRVIVEAKATERLHAEAANQLYNYLRAMNLELGILLHFGRQAKFYRVVCQHPLSLKNSLNSSNSNNS